MPNEVCHWHGVALYLAQPGRLVGCPIINLRPLIDDLAPPINDQGRLIANLTPLIANQAAAITNPVCQIVYQGLQI